MGLRVSNEDGVFFAASRGDTAATLVAVVCHEKRIPGSAVECSSLNVPQAALLACGQPASVSAEIAEAEAISLLEDRGISVDVASTVEGDLATDKDAELVELFRSTGTPERFHKAARLQLLRAVHKRGEDLADGWASLPADALVGAGGGGT